MGRSSDAASKGVIIAKPSPCRNWGRAALWCESHGHAGVDRVLRAHAACRAPGAERLEFCHTDKHGVLRRGWAPIAEGCVPAAQDTVIALD